MNNKIREVVQWSKDCPSSRFVFLKDHKIYGKFS